MLISLGTHEVQVDRQQTMADVYMQVCHKIVLQPPK